MSIAEIGARHTLAATLAEAGLSLGLLDTDLAADSVPVPTLPIIILLLLLVPRGWLVAGCRLRQIKD
jgi:hypothetical protein